MVLTTPTIRMLVMIKLQIVWTLNTFTVWFAGSTTFLSPKGPERLHGLSINGFDV